MEVSRRLAYSITVILFLVSSSMNSQVLSSSKIKELSKSVVKIYAQHDKAKTSTGFVFKSGNQVVTSLHVVSGASKIQVKTAGGGLITARVSKVFKDKDLALLKLDEETGASPLTFTSNSIQSGQKLICIGYPFNIPTSDETILTAKEQGKRLKDIIPPKVKKSLDNIGFPDTEGAIVSLDGHLLPGHSGAPIFNKDGLVSAISNGGLAVGGASRSWAISASHLNALMNSSESIHNRSVVSEQLFAEELSPDFEREVLTDTSSGQKFIYIREASYYEMLWTTDDPEGLNLLASTYYNIDPTLIRYKIYRDTESGASIVIPADMDHPTVSNGLWTSSSEDGLVDMYFKTDDFNFEYEAQEKSIEFEMSTVMGDDEMNWQQDPNWTYPFIQPTLDGMLVRRLAYIKYEAMNYEWFPVKQLIITYSIKQPYLLSAAAKLNDQYSSNSYSWFAGATAAFLTTVAN